MKYNIAKLCEDIKKGTMDRRQLIQGLAATGTAALAASALPRAATAFAASAAQTTAKGGKAFPVTTINHLGLGVADYAKSRDFYVELFGMRVAWDNGKVIPEQTGQAGCAVEFGSLTSPNGLYIRALAKPGDKPTINHIAFGIPNFMSQKAGMKAEMERWDLKNVRPDGEKGWSCDDPAGYFLNIWVPEKDEAMYPGADKPCLDAKAATCKAGWDAGQTNLNAAPKPSGKGFKAMYFSHVILHVPQSEIPKERDFYTRLLGMKVISDKADGPNPEVLLGFNKNTLYLRKTDNPSDKPYCVEYGFVIQNYDKTKVKAELDRRGLKPEADGDGWTFHDPDGLKIGIYSA